MLSRHVIKDLSAYCQGELTDAQTREFAQHLIGCARCRAELEEIKAGISLAEQLPHYAMPDAWSEIEPMVNAKFNAGRDEALRPAFMTSWSRLAAIAAGVLITVGVGAFLVWRNVSRPSLAVARLDGTPRIGSATIRGKSRLAIGQWLETDSSSRAQIEVGSIGLVDIDPNTRVRLLQTRPTEHRLELAQGKVSAKIWAPPRLFFVNTPSAVAADLGCAYTLEVNNEGASLLRVTLGWVALQLRDRESTVPAGAACQTRPLIGPGTPYFEDASEEFQNALTRFDFESKTPPDTSNALHMLLNTARTRDSLTLWNLLFRVQGENRLRVYERLAELAPVPSGVDREGVLQLRKDMLETWKNSLEKTWYDYPSDPSLKILKKSWPAGEKITGTEGKK